MNILKTHTVATEQSDTFRVYWTNSTRRVGGILTVRITAKIEDRNIAAELAAMHHLLEVKCVLGNMLVGNTNTQLVVSLGAIRKLQRAQSDKAHLVAYAKFLTTRFAGCPLKVDKDTSWIEGFTTDVVENLLISAPQRETLHITGLGDVEVTQHVLALFSDRFLAETAPNKAAQAAWTKLNQIASDKTVREVVRNSLWSAAKYMRQGCKEGRYFLNEKLDLILVVTDNPREGKRLVTTYPATRHFHDMSIAA